MISNFSLPTSLSPQNSSIEFTSLLDLRWGAILCQVLLIVLMDVSLEETIPYPIVTAIIGFETLSNLIFHYFKEKHYTLHAWLFFAVMLVDVFLLTILLFQTGGAMNPFSFLYLLHIVIGAILMPHFWAWGLTIVTNISYLSLYFPFFSSLSQPNDSSNSLKTVCVDLLNSAATTESKMDLHLKGMLVAFGLTSFFIVYFIGKIRTALEGHHQMITKLKEEKNRSSRLASLATLAAGTAHELSTPLSTIKLVSGELLQSLKHLDDTDETKSDINLIRDQINRCEEVLYQMSAGAGEHRGEQFQLFSSQKLIQEAIFLLPGGADRIRTNNLSSDFILYAPLQTFKRTIKSLLKNSIDASSETAIDIELSCWHDEDHLFFRVTDHGSGMNDDTLAKATEPFFTTKNPGEGMGLGLYLAKSVAEQFDGELTISSKVNIGTDISLSIRKDLISKEKDD